MTFGSAASANDLANEAIEALGGAASLREQVTTIAGALERQPHFVRATELAALAHGLAGMGRHEATVCVAVLQSFSRLASPRQDDTSDSAAESALRQALIHVDLARDREVPTHSGVLESIVNLAAQTIGARYGSLFLVDEQTQELVFEVSLREGVEELRRFRLPLGRGIAGLVAVTGQPIAVSDVAGDPRHAADIAERTGYVPKNMLCVPLQTGERVVGVLELMDKHGDDSFSLADMQALGEFASRAAERIEHSRLHQNVVRMLVLEVRRLASQAADQNEDASRFSGDAVFQQALEIGRSVVAIAEGDAELASACGAVVGSLQAYARAKRSDPAGLAR
jgi:GAF domain-containing protein